MMPAAKESFSRFYRQYSRPLWLYIIKICGDESLADDIFQDTFIKFLKAVPGQLNEYRQKAYLYKIATHLIIDLKRKIKRIKQESLEEHHAGGIDAADPLAAIDLDRLFRLLKPRARTLLWLAYVEGYSHREIQEITGIKEKAVKVYLFRAKKKFAAILNRPGSPWRKHENKDNAMSL